ncbi:hypothetical protein FNZ56_04600 [Pseudoluteimonas lycopersici]|uniref:DUF2975 domain-containing protein n=1 Tax=Pseudoluteimonas lycopersici TaxID=1324796 RepID=A0A516V3U1_9GAMM|nr:hypothetical protein [Lysobacter lycopersici]QDQ73199.1 hypothetical protein FNZ56_04600 [Lysobacter lycopersici]
MKPQTRLLPPLLVSAAWLGMLLCPLYAIVIGGAARAMAGAPKIAHDAASGATIHFDIVPFDAWTVSSLAAMVALQWFVLWQLRGVGAALLRQPGIGAGVASAFRRLGHALFAYGLFGIVVPTPARHVSALQVQLVAERFGYSQVYLIAVACLCAYATAWLLGESLRLKEENEGFV